MIFFIDKVNIIVQTVKRIYGNHDILGNEINNIAVLSDMFRLESENNNFILKFGMAFTFFFSTIDLLIFTEKYKKMINFLKYFFIFAIVTSVVSNNILMQAVNEVVVLPFNTIIAPALNISIIDFK